MTKRRTSKIEKNHHHHQDGDETDDTDITDGSSNHNNNENNNNNNNNENNNETMFSKALLNLSFQDRNQIEEEMHGVSCMAIIETKESIELSLYLFEIELELLEKEHKIAYQKAIHLITNIDDPLALSSSFILSKEMKLRFLRTELFDVSKSAIRYTKYIDLLYELYGDIALQRPIRIDNLNRVELSYLKSGQYQLLPYRDRSGRRILVDVTNSELLIHAPRKVFVSLLSLIL